MYDVSCKLDFIVPRVICLHLDIIRLNKDLHEVSCQEEHIECNKTDEVNPDKSVVGNHFVVDCLDSLADLVASVKNDK